jgi:hypothetical protein
MIAPFLFVFDKRKFDVIIKLLVIYNVVPILLEIAAHSLEA